LEKIIITALADCLKINLSVMVHTLEQSLSLRHSRLQRKITIFANVKEVPILHIVMERIKN